MFTKGFQKTAGIKTEVAGAVANPIPLSILGAAIGGIKGNYTKEEQAAADKKTWSNILIPGVGGYRLARRRNKNK